MIRHSKINSKFNKYIHFAAIRHGQSHIEYQQFIYFLMDKGNNAYLFLKQILYLYRIIGSILKKSKIRHRFYVLGKEFNPRCWRNLTLFLETEFGEIPSKSASILESKLNITRQQYFHSCSVSSRHRLYT